MECLFLTKNHGVGEILQRPAGHRDHLQVVARHHGLAVLPDGVEEGRENSEVADMQGRGGVVGVGDAERGIGGGRGGGRAISTDGTGWR